MASLHPRVRMILTADIEMRLGHFAQVRSDESSKSQISFAGRAGVTTSILRQHSLANAQLGESFTLHIIADIIIQIIIK